MTLSTRARSLVGSGGSPWRGPGPPAAYLRFRGPAVVFAGTPGNSPFSFSSSLRIRPEASTAARPWGDGGGDTEGARRPRGVCVGGGGERSSRSCCRRSGLYRPPTQPGLRPRRCRQRVCFASGFPPLVRGAQGSRRARDRTVPHIFEPESSCPASLAPCRCGRAGSPWPVSPCFATSRGGFIYKVVLEALTFCQRPEISGTIDRKM